MVMVVIVMVDGGDDGNGDDGYGGDGDGYGGDGDGVLVADDSDCLLTLWYR